MNAVSIIIGVFVAWAVYAFFFRDELRRRELAVYIHDNLAYLIAAIHQVDHLRQKYCPDAEEAAGHLEFAKISIEFIGEQLQTMPATQPLDQLETLKATLDEALRYVGLARRIVFNRMTHEQLVEEGLERAD